MSIYGESSGEFRPHPSPLAVMLVSLGGLVLASHVAHLIVAGIDTMLAWGAGWESVLIVFVPFADDPFSPFFFAPPLGSVYRASEIAVAGGSILFGIIFAGLWPTSAGLASRFFAHLAGLIAIVDGALATALRPGAFTDSAKLMGAPRWLLLVVVIVVSIGTIAWVEHRTVLLLSNVLDQRSMLRRIGIWLLRIPIGLGLLAVVAWVNGWMPGVAALGAAVIVTFFACAPYPPPPWHEDIEAPTMIGAAILYPLLAIALTAGSVVLFGMRGGSVPNRILTFRDGGVKHETVPDELRRQLRDPESLEKLRNVIRFRGKEYELPKKDD